MPIHYVVGDATQPIRKDNDTACICHVCNDIGGWGAGFVVALSKRWSEPEQRYRAWYRQWFNYVQDRGQNTAHALPLGGVQMVQAVPGIVVANMVGQWGTGRDENGNPPVRYGAIFTALEKVVKKAHEKGNWTLHMPRIGCGLAGGKWHEIECILNALLEQYGDLDIYVYDLPGKPFVE